MTAAGSRGGSPAFSAAVLAMMLIASSESRAASDSATATRQLEYRLGIAGASSNLRVALDLGASLDRRSTGAGAA